MLFKDIPIRAKIMRIVFLISGVILLVTSGAFLFYEVYSFRHDTKQKLSTLGQIIADNSAAALAFNDKVGASELLLTLKAEPQIIVAALYDSKGKLFASFHQGSDSVQFPAASRARRSLYNGANLDAFHPIVKGGKYLGGLYLKSESGGMYERFRLVAITTVAAVVLSLLLAYFLSTLFQKSISKPILDLAATAREISHNRDFSVRTVKSGNDELGFLSDSFNNMIQEIQTQSNSLKEANEKLDKSEKFFRAMTEQNIDMKTLSTANGKIYYASPSITKVLGYSEDEFLNINLSDLFHPDDFPQYIEKRSALMDTPGASFFHEARLRHRNGNWLWCDGTISNMIQEPAVEGIVATFRDITDKKNSEEAIRLAEASYREIFDKTAHAIYVFNIDTGKIMEANKRAFEMTGYSQEELLKNGASPIFIDNLDFTEEKALSYFKNAAMGQSQVFEWKLKKKDGSFHWIEVHLIKATIAGKERILSFFDEINERKNAQLDIQNLNLELEQKVINRTVELEIANRELEAFSYSVSHDLRAPLRAINGYAKMVWEDYKNVLDEEGKRLFSRIEDNAKKMGLLIDELLEFSRMGRKEVHKTEVDMSALAQLSLSELNAGTEHRAEVEIHYLHAAQADPALLKQVLVNLLSNAVKYSSKVEKPHVEVRSEVQGDEIIYSISDNGVGFNNQYLDKLFGVFQRLHLQSEFEGTGVGLALAKRIINKHGGRIWASGELNKGATFSFSLPIVNKNQNTTDGQFAN